jgi:hypothetical protein
MLTNMHSTVWTNRLELAAFKDYKTSLTPSRFHSGNRATPDLFAKALPFERKAAPGAGLGRMRQEQRNPDKRKMGCRVEAHRFWN